MLPQLMRDIHQILSEARMMQACGWYALCRSPVKLFIMLLTIASLVVREEEKEEKKIKLNR